MTLLSITETFFWIFFSVMSVFAALIAGGFIKVVKKEKKEDAEQVPVDPIGSSISNHFDDLEIDLPEEKEITEVQLEKQKAKPGKKKKDTKKVKKQ